MKTRKFRVSFIVEVAADKLPKDSAAAAQLAEEAVTNAWDEDVDSERFHDSYDFHAEEL